MFSFNHLGLQQSDSMDEKLSTNLEDLAINGMDAFRMLNGYCQENIFPKQCFDETPPIFLNDFHAVFSNLITLTVRNSSFEILFPAKGSTGNRNKKISLQIKHLRLYDLEKIEYIFHVDFPSDHPLLQCLQDLSIRNCPSLISLVSSSTSFTNLTSLKVYNCKEQV
ncbi:unnamed protein product [Trifolium pratense]|uniref:Uncharacterized protein n=1 Tax=Trifolium pratense TaxID=57577 RepID=A0ACB0LWG1_TRIPR|nr:unnamed protein product [Trifolium pratense]